MADVNSDDDPDSAAMAEAMGFTGFGMQRSKKRKLTPPAQTGANNAPLGKRRPLNLPQPVVSGGGGNAEEIDLDDDDDGDGDGAGAQSNAGEAEEDDIQTQAGMDALTFNDAPPGTGGRPHHQLPPKPQQQHQHHHAGKPGRHPGGRAGGGAGGSGQAPWWEGEWDPRLVGRMVENPWERLEGQRGLGARGTWPAARGARGSGGGDAAAALAPDGGAGPAGAGGGGAVSSLGGFEQAAQATVS